MAGEEPTNGEHIHGGFDGAVTETVFADAGGSWTVVDWAFGDAEAHAFDECWDEPVHSVKGDESVAALGSHDLEGATGIADAVFGEA